MAKSELKMCNEYNLDWDQNPIKILGITFDPGILDIWDLNSVELITQLENTSLNLAKKKINATRQNYSNKVIGII